MERKFSTINDHRMFDMNTRQFGIRFYNSVDDSKTDTKKMRWRSPLDESWRDTAQRNPELQTRLTERRGDGILVKRGITFQGTCQNRWPRNIANMIIHCNARLHFATITLIERYHHFDREAWYQQFASLISKSKILVLTSANHYEIQASWFNSTESGLHLREPNKIHALIESSQLRNIDLR